MKTIPDDDILDCTEGRQEPHPFLAFLSHTSSDLEFIQTNIIPKDSSYYHHFIIFNYRFPGGLLSDAYRKQILRLMADAAWFVVAVSPQAVESKWVQFEVSWAVEHRHPSEIVVLIVEDCDWARLSDDLRQCHQIDFRENRLEGRQQMEMIMPDVCSA